MSEAEETEVLPVPAGEVLLTRSSDPLEVAPVERRSTGVVIPAAAAAGGFVAGAAVIGLVGRHRRAAALTRSRRTALFPRHSGSSRRSPAAGEMLQIVASRSLLLDVHLLGGPGSDH